MQVSERIDLHTDSLLIIARNVARSIGKIYARSYKMQ